MIASVYREFALELAVESGKVIRPYFTHTRAPSFVPDLKNDGTIVTDADREAERLMREMIGRVFPDHGIIGEEYGVPRSNIYAAVYMEGNRRKELPML